MGNLVLNSVESNVKEVEKDSNVLVNAGKSLVNASKSVVNAGKNVEIDIKKLVIPFENRWKSQRNPFSMRSKFDIVRYIVSGGVVAAALYSTYAGVCIRHQVMLYATCIGVLTLADPIKLFRCMLSNTSRYIITFMCMLLVLCITKDNTNLWRVFYITLVAAVVSIYFLNDMWCKAESWKFSKEVEHAMVLDSENKAYDSWQANGKFNTKSLLFSLGVSVSESDLDVFMKAVYFMGFWNSLEYQKKYMQDELQMEKVYSNTLERENKELIDDYNELLDELRETQKEHSALIRKYNQLVLYAKKLKESSKKEEPPAKQNSIELPKGVTMEQYEKVIEMLDNGDSQNYIEKVTGIKRYRIRQIIEKRGVKNV